MATTPAPETPQTWHHGLVAKWWSEFRAGLPTRWRTKLGM
jgi:hypothetical protein